MDDVVLSMMIFIKIRLTNFRVNQKENNSKLLQLLMKKKLKIDFFERFPPPLFGELPKKSFFLLDIIPIIIKVKRVFHGSMMYLDRIYLCNV